MYLHGLKLVPSFTLSGKHMTYTYTHALILIYSKPKTLTDIQKQISELFMNSYNKFIYILVLIADLYLFISLV